MASDRKSTKHLFPEIAHAKKRALLTAYVSTGGIYRAAKSIDTDTRMHYYWLKNDPTYADAYERAKEMAGDFAEDEVYRRAFHGTDHPVIYQGEITGSYKEYSDTLAMFYLKALRPEKYRENTQMQQAVLVQPQQLPPPQDDEGDVYAQVKQAMLVLLKNGVITPKLLEA